MNSQQYQRLKQHFHEACEAEPLARAALLERLGQEDPGLRRDVENLLTHDRELSDFLARPALDRSAFMSDADGPAPPRPQQIGRYQVLDVLGEGGMGIVYLAEQESPRRTVALKVVKSGFVADATLRRFQHEAQLLGRLQHPNIAQVFEAGTAATERGCQPFFAMELVRGRPIDDFARQHMLGTRQRLELMTRVCDAVHHAHQKGVIHRDLKPSNILVDESTSVAQPKVLDFGVARATDSDIAASTLRTDIGQLIGTIPYMSPEQIRGDSLELDTRTDVYSLGVVCYELLAGQLPFDLARKTIPEAARIIGHDEPAPLSSINRVFRGDLDTIVGKAMEKDKSRRYQSAAELGADIQRYLSDEPIVARPATAMYQLRKFARRNKPLVAGLATALVILALGVAGITWQAIRATGQSTRAEAVTAFLASILNSVDPDVARGRDISILRQLLDDAAQRVEHDLASQPLARAEVEQTIGNTYWAIGLFQQAEQHLRASLELREQELAHDDPVVIEAKRKLGRTLEDAGRRSESVTLLREALEGALVRLGPDDAQVASIQTSLAEVLWADRFARGPIPHDHEPEQLFRHALATTRAARGENHRDVARILQNLGLLLQDRKELDGAAQCYEQAMDILVNNGVPEESRPVTSLMFQVGTLEEARGEKQQAEATHRRYLELTEPLLGRHHPSRAVAYRHLARLLSDRGNLEEAESTIRAALEIDRIALGPDHTRVADDMTVLGTTIDAAARRSPGGPRAEAEELLRGALAIYINAMPPDHPWIARARGNLARVLHGQKRFAEAEPLLRDALASLRLARGQDAQDTPRVLIDLGAAVESQGRLDEAEPLYAEALETRRKVLPPGHAATGDALSCLGRVKQGLGDAAAAEPLLREAIEVWGRRVSATDWRVVQAKMLLGDSIRIQGRFDEAETLIHAAYETLLSAHGPRHGRTQRALKLLVTLYEAWGRPEQESSFRALLTAESEPGAP